MRKPIKALPIALATLAMLLSTAAFAQTTKVGECDLAFRFGEKDATAFLQFDRELRESITQSDAGKLALLVTFPLRVNGARGTYYIQDAASLEGQFEEVFVPAVRAAITNQPIEKTWCNYAGIMYGNGLVWVNPGEHGYGLEAINMPELTRETRATAGQVEFVCRTDQERVIVDVGLDRLPRYRAWTKPHSIADKPDIELTAGKKTLEGTGPCTTRVWSFSDAGRQFVLLAGGCHPDSSPPPAAATGQLSISSAGATLRSPWCF